MTAWWYERLSPVAILPTFGEDESEVERNNEVDGAGDVEGDDRGQTANLRLK